MNPIPTTEEENRGLQPPPSSYHGRTSSPSQEASSRPLNSSEESNRHMGRSLFNCAAHLDGACTRVSAWKPPFFHSLRTGDAHPAHGQSLISLALTSQGCWEGERCWALLTGTMRQSRHALQVCPPPATFLWQKQAKTLQRPEVRTAVTFIPFR